MASRLKVIYLPGRGADPTWEREVIAAIGPHHDLAIFDDTAPLGPQFADVDAVVDLGGSWGRREHLDAAPKVRFWQIMGTGIEQLQKHYDWVETRQKSVELTRRRKNSAAPDGP